MATIKKVLILAVILTMSASVPVWSAVEGVLTSGATQSNDGTTLVLGAVGEAYLGGGQVSPGFVSLVQARRGDQPISPGPTVPDPPTQPPESPVAGSLSGEIAGSSVTLTYTLLDGSPANLTLVLSSDGRTLQGTGILPLGDVTITMTRSSGSANDLTGTYAVDFGGDDLTFTLTQSGVVLTGSGGKPRDDIPGPPSEGLVAASGTFDGSVATLSSTVDGFPLSLILTLSTDGTRLSGTAQLGSELVPFTFTLKTRTGGSDPLDGIWEAIDEGELIVLDLDQIGNRIQTRVAGEPSGSPLLLPAPLALEIGYLSYLFDEGIDLDRDGLVNINDFLLSLSQLGNGEADSGGAGRIRVYLPVLSREEPTFWNRLVVASRASERGSFFLPEVEDEVLVAFLEGDPNLPQILGQTYNGTDAPAETEVDDGRVVIRGKLESIDSRDGAIVLGDVRNPGKGTRILVEGARLLFAEKPIDPFEGSPWEVIAEEGAYWESLFVRADAFDPEFQDQRSLVECDFVVAIGERASSGIVASGLISLRLSAPPQVVANPDFDGDGEVGFSDFISFAGAFGRLKGDVGFEAKFDLDGDDEIGFVDFLVFAQAFGT